jgi:proteasome lid subunit RPN8/RPN11
VRNGALRLAPELAEQLLHRARASEPREACGLLLGAPGRATRLVEVANIAPEPDRFEAHPGQWRAALDGAVARGEVALAAWHSHPVGAALPGHRDACADWKELPVLLVSPAGSPRLRAWRRIEGGWLELPLQIGAAPSEEAPTRAPCPP